MSQSDKIKANNSTLRYWLSVVVGLTILCIATLVNDYRADKATDEVTVLAILATVLGVILSGVIQHLVNRNTRKLGDI